MKHSKYPAAVRNLLSRPDPERIDDIDKALTEAERALPLSTAHAKDLPFAVRDLSRLLTSERGELSRSYWAAPRFVSAYLRYFLPWNLVRLSWLMPGLELKLAPGSTILDLGSGPLTMPIALWCARPDLRSVPLRFFCTDVAIKAMEHGKRILSSMAGKDSPWQIELVRGPFDKILHQSRGRDYTLIMAGNVLNEVCAGHSDAESHLAGRLEELSGLTAGALAPGGRLLLVEPGSRLGGKLIALFRKGALRNGFSALVPCTHDGLCPMEAASSQGGSGYSGWCHFIHPVDDAPDRLADLTYRARLEKESVAISCLLLEAPSSLGRHFETAGNALARNHAVSAGKNGGLLHEDTVGAIPGAAREADDLDELEALYREIMEEDSAALGAPAPVQARSSLSHASSAHGAYEQHKLAKARSCAVRVISGPIRLPDADEPARYGCCEDGLALVEGARRIPSGGGVVAHIPAHPRRDAKSGALLLSLEQRESRRTDDEQKASRNQTGKHGEERDTEKETRKIHSGRTRKEAGGYSAPRSGKGGRGKSKP